MEDFCTDSRVPFCNHPMTWILRKLPKKWSQYLNICPWDRSLGSNWISQSLQNQISTILYIEQASQFLDVRKPTSTSSMESICRRSTSSEPGLEVLNVFYWLFWSCWRIEVSRKFITMYSSQSLLSVPSFRACWSSWWNYRLVTSIRSDLGSPV